MLESNPNSKATFRQNINTVKDFLYLLKDETNDCIITASESYDAAAAVSLFSPRISLVPIETHKRHLKSKLRAAEFKNPNVVLRWNSRAGVKRDIQVVNDFPPGLMAFRSEINERLFWQEKLKTHCDMMLKINGPETPMLEEYLPSVLDELVRCDPASGSYTAAVKSYAAISEISESAAYDELRLHCDNLAHSRLRNLAIYIKFRNQLNEAAVTEQETVFRSAMAAIYRIGR